MSSKNIRGSGASPGKLRASCAVACALLPSLAFIRLALTLLVLTQLIPVTQARADSVLTAMLDRYTGKWLGTVQVYSSDGDLIEEWNATQQYWWDGDVQRAVAVIDRNGSLTYAESFIAIEEGRLVSRTFHGDTKVRDYLGRPLDRDTIAWIPSDADIASDMQTIERIVIGNGLPRLIIEGHEILVVDQERRTFKIQATLRRPSNSESAD